MVSHKGVAGLPVKGGDFTDDLFVLIYRVGEFFDLAALLGGEGTVAGFGRFGLAAFGLASHGRVLRRGILVGCDGFTVGGNEWRR